MNHSRVKIEVVAFFAAAVAGFDMIDSMTVVTVFDLIERFVVVELVLEVVSIVGKSCLMMEPGLSSIVWIEQGMMEIVAVFER